MEYNLITNVESCYIQLPQLLYYSHWPSILVSLFFGLFVFFKSGRSLLGKILLSISISFSLWAILNLIVWITVDSIVYSFFWSFFETLSILFYFLVLYFGYVFIEEKSVSPNIKLIFLAIFFPVAIISSTKYYLVGFNAATCDAIINDKFLYCIYFLKGLTFIGVLLLLLSKYIKYRKDENKKAEIIIGGTGLILLLSSFLITQYFGDLVSADLYTIEFYGLFAIDIFIGFLAYLIVQYKTFNIKLLNVQALVATLVILIGSQFAFIRNNTNRILTSITLSLAIGFGWFLIRSVKKEIKQREELEIANMEIEKRNEAIVERNEQLRSANAEITERKDQLQKIADALAVANDKLQKLDTAKTEFVSMASHQLRTPPTSIKGYSSMLLENSYGELNAEQKIAIEHISSANNQQIAFVEDMLNVSRIESGSMKFEFGKFKIEKLCQDVIDILVFKAKDKNIYLDYRAPDAPLPELTIDGAKIREVLSNLVDNAVKYTLRGGVTISTEICAKEEANCLEMPHIRVTISDTGIGIPAEEIPYLFHKFSRGKDISRLNTGGTGLGLYVVKMITEANGGKVWIESPGKDLGTKFMLELPLEQLEETLMKNG